MKTVNAYPALATLVAALAASVPGTASAEAGDWFVRVGAHNVDPASDNGALAGGALQAEIGSNTRPTFVLGYMLTSNWAIELLAAAPFRHEVALNGSDAASFRQLPPTLSFDYHFMPDRRVSPFLGLGVNYTWTYDESTRGPLAGTELKIGNSWGLAAHAGLAFKVAEHWDLVADVRWMDIDADVRVDGADVGSVSVDPLVYGIYASYRF